MKASFLCIVACICLSTMQADEKVLVESPILAPAWSVYAMPSGTALPLVQKNKMVEIDLSSAPSGTSFVLLRPKNVTRIENFGIFKGMSLSVALTREKGAQEPSFDLGVMLLDNQGQSKVSYISTGSVPEIEERFAAVQFTNPNYINEVRGFEGQPRPSVKELLPWIEFQGLAIPCTGNGRLSLVLNSITVYFDKALYLIE